MANRRALRQDEIDEARKVYKETIQYQNVYIEETDGGIQVWAYSDLRMNWYYVIFWGSDGYNRGTINSGEARTFIHELTHVWQGHTGTFPREYMIKSGASQTGGVLRDAWDKGAKEVLKRIWEKGPIGAWHSFRNRAYAFSMNQIGVNNFNDFNVEQQASIVESWYASDAKQNHLGETIPGGNMSTTDARYPYITGNILASSPTARYIPLQNNTAPTNQLGRGADPIIKAIQDKLVELRYLDPKYADGYMGRHTREAVRGFQRNNGLKVDGDIGGPNSETRKKLGIR